MEGVPDHLEEQIKALEMGKQGIGKDEEKVKKPKIQRVPYYLEERGFGKYFKPQIISFGPFHWCNYKPYMSVGERYKDIWTTMYLVETNQQHSCDALLDRIDDLKDEVLDSVPKICGTVGDYLRNWEKGRWLLIRDGCSILQVLDKSIHDDAEKELNVRIDHLLRVHQDMLLLENQIPFKLLKLICNDNAKLKRCMHNFINIYIAMITGNQDLMLENDDHLIAVDEAEEEDPVHLLDYLHSSLLMKTSRDAIVNLPQRNQHANIKRINRPVYLINYKIEKIRELKNKGIQFQKHYSHDNVLHPIFNSYSGELQLPQLTVAASTMLIFLNLIAYEMCPDFRNDFKITSFVLFLSSLIETPEDVKELRSCGVLINQLASDKEVSDFFHQMDTLLLPDTYKYFNIRYQMENYYVSHQRKIEMQQKMLDWKRDAYSSFLRSPWKFIALLAATLGLILTFIQTWLAIHPKCS